MLQFLLGADAISHKPHRCGLDVPIYGNTHRNTPIAPVSGWRQTATTTSHYRKFFSAKAYRVSGAPQFLSLSLSGFPAVPCSSGCFFPSYHFTPLLYFKVSRRVTMETIHAHALQFVVRIKCFRASLWQMSDGYEVECACVSERVHLSTDGSLIWPHRASCHSCAVTQTQIKQYGLYSRRHLGDTRSTRLALLQSEGEFTKNDSGVYLHTQPALF